MLLLQEVEIESSVWFPSIDVADMDAVFEEFSGANGSIGGALLVQFSEESDGTVAENTGTVAGHKVVADVENSVCGTVNLLLLIIGSL